MGSPLSFFYPDLLGGTVSSAAGRDIGTGIAASGRDGEAVEVVVPNPAVLVDRVGRQAAVREAHARLLALGMQGDLDRGGARRDRVVLLVPAEGEDDLLLRHHLDVLADGLVQTLDEHTVGATGRGSMSATVPNHSRCLVLSVRNGQMVSGVASITISRTSSAIGGLLLLLCGLGRVAQPFEAAGPVVIEEVAELAHLVLTRLVQAPGVVASLAHEPRPLEHAEVLRDRRAA